MRRSGERLSPHEQKAAREEMRKIQRQYHENRRKAEEEGNVAPIGPAAASSCCNAGVFWSKAAVICKECGKVQE